MVVGAGPVDIGAQHSAIAHRGRHVGLFGDLARATSRAGRSGNGPRADHLLTASMPAAGEGADGLRRNACHNQRPSTMHCVLVGNQTRRSFAWRTLLQHRHRQQPPQRPAVIERGRDFVGLGTRRHFGVAEASLVEGVEVWGVRTLGQLHKWLTGAAHSTTGSTLRRRRPSPLTPPMWWANRTPGSPSRFSAAAGAHHLMMTVRPVGKTMLAQRLRDHPAAVVGSRVPGGYGDPLCAGRRQAARRSLPGRRLLRATPLSRARFTADPVDRRPRSCFGVPLAHGLAVHPATMVRGLSRMSLLQSLHPPANAAAACIRL